MYACTQRHRASVIHLRDDNFEMMHRDAPESAAALDWFGLRRAVKAGVRRGLETEPPLDTRVQLRRVCVTGSLGAGDGRPDSDVDLVVELHTTGPFHFPPGFDHVLSPETTLLSRAYDTAPRTVEERAGSKTGLEFDVAVVPSAETLAAIDDGDNYPDYADHVRSRAEHGGYDRLYDVVAKEHLAVDAHLDREPADGWGDIDVTGFPDE